MKDNKYTITFQDDNGNPIWTKTIKRTHIEEVESAAFFMINANQTEATTWTITKL